MLNVMRIMFFVELGILLLNMIVSGVQFGDWFPMTAITDCVTDLLWILFLNIGVICYTVCMGHRLTTEVIMEKNIPVSCYHQFSL